jgi:polyphosphate glucokinase
MFSDSPDGRQARAPDRGPRTLAIDVGASGLKASVLDSRGRMVHERVRIKTPKPCPPGVLIRNLCKLVAALPEFDRVSIGFPGFVRKGRVLTAPNLGADEAWHGYRLAKALERRLGKPARLVNDADMQGLAAIKGKGLELVVTLGTGVGTALFLDGRLLPHLEISHHVVWDNVDYDAYIGDATRKRIGKKKWNRRVRRALDQMRLMINFDKLHIGGGNAKRITFELDRDMRIVSNRAGILGGIKLWEMEQV